MEQTFDVSKTKQIKSKVDAAWWHPSEKFLTIHNKRIILCARPQINVELKIYWQQFEPI
jgi:hypothetical protein